MQKKTGRASQQSAAGPHTQCKAAEQSKGEHIIEPCMLVLYSWPERNHQLSAAIFVKCDISCSFSTANRPTLSLRRVLLL